jgi:hypothetical protein
VPVSPAAAAGITLGLGAAGLVTYWVGVNQKWWAPIPNPFGEPGASRANRAEDDADRARQVAIEDLGRGRTSAQGYVGTPIGTRGNYPAANRARRGGARYAYTPSPPLTVDGQRPVPDRTAPLREPVGLTGGPAGRTSASNQTVMRRLVLGSM